MRQVLAVLLALPSFAGSSCKSTPSPAPEPAPSAAPAAKPAAQTAGAAQERSGVFAPAAPAAISIWPEAYSGEMLVVEVLPQGTAVNEGDVIARLDTRSIDEQVHQAELEATSASVRTAGVVEKNRIDDDAAAAAFEAARASLERAKRTLEGWTTRELVFSKRGDEIGKKNEDAGIDDQKDELAQLEKMYEADELVDATEEIVLKRSRRRLAISEDARTLSHDRRSYRVEFDEAMQTEIKQEAVKTQQQSLDRLVRSQAVEKRAREDALARAKDALDQQESKLERLRRDRERLAIRAPRAGVLLHGKEKDYRPGKTPARFERGSQIPLRTEVFLVADPEKLAVAVDIPESMLGQAREGASVEVKAVAASGSGGTGTLHLETYPSTKVGEENGFEAKVELGSSIPGVLFGMRAKVALAAAP